MKLLRTTMWSVVVVVTVASFMAALDNSIVSVTLPQMQNAFHTDLGTITWVATIYFLTQAAVIPISGYLSDLIGSKVSFLAALALFTVGSLLCTLAPTKEALITFRALQGIGSGALVPLSYAIIYRAFPPAKRSAAVSIVSVPTLMAPVLGPTLGGYLSTTYGWNAVFLVNVPLGILVLQW